MKKAVPPTGRPIARRRSARAVWCAPPRNVSGAQPTRKPFRLAPPSTSSARLGDVDAERLFGMDVLAGGERLQPDLDMRLRDGEVDDDLDRRIGEQRVDRARGQAEFRGPRLGRLGIDVGERDDVEDREISSPPSDRRR